MSNATAPGTSPRRRLIEDLRRRTAAAELREIPRLESRLERLGRTRLEEAEFLRRLAAVEREVDRSIARVAARRAAPVALEFDPKLPITAHRDEIVTAIEKHQVLIVCGETGSGKSTQLPKLCLAAGRGTAGLIGHTQPRRIAARAIADRLATELGVALGAEVGYQVRFTDRTGPRARVKLMTDGILLRELEHDRELRRYDTLIIDEAHERSLNVDFLLGYLHRIAARRPDLRVVITSATIDTDRFSQFFAGAPVINVSGRSYTVEVRYRPLEATDDGDSDERTLIDGVTDAVAELVDSGGSRGDILVFLPGERQIRASAIALDRRGPRGIEILPLFARQSAAEQARVFAPHSAQRVILATNVAETSLTVPGVRYVVDTGLARISRYSPRIRVQRLPVEPVSQASADQRKGRCGREAPGVCIRLYSEESYAEREAQTPPEILRTNLASVILQMAALGLGDPENFPFIDAPDTRLIGDGYRLLEELGAVDSERRVTRVGRDMAALPVDPRLARMLIAAGREGCLSEMLVLAAFLSIQDPRERSDDRVTREEASPDATSVTEDARSDFVSVLNLWKAYHEVAPEVSRSALRRWCKARSLAFLRMREWEDLVGQLTQAVADVGLKQTARPATYQQLHRAILSGLLGQVGQREERREYAG
ncbi:MAG TPA: ATP-dependent RNA helicase HrpA, partial [Steroidobacteraceae bacterium]|nr:ATP-dependent RNA helicase HrpA [Steroidobacteraceae bacterium]